MDADHFNMTRFESLLNEARISRRHWGSSVNVIAKRIGELYEDTQTGEQVAFAIRDLFFPLNLFIKHHLNGRRHSKGWIEMAAQDLARLSKMFLRIRMDIERCFDSRAVTCVDLRGDTTQKITSEQWCTFCGECCQLTGTIPDPVEGISYPGYWYSYIAGDSPINQKFCPFLFEMPSQNLFFCSIHNVKPQTCMAYGERECISHHPGKAHHV
jgi:hypothetical protein